MMHGHVEVGALREDRITEVEIDPEGRLRVRPESADP